MAKQGSNGDFTLDKALPSSIEAERLILGVALLDNMAINQALENLKPDDFFIGSNRRIYEKMIALYERGQAIDPLTLQEELRRAGELEQVGGPAYIAALFDGVPRFSNIENYVKIVKGKSTLRRLITSANQIMAMAFDDEEEPEVILDKAESLILAIGEDRIKQGFVHVGDVATRQLTVIEETAGREQLITGLATGFADLDYMTSGLQRGDLIIIAARPSMGKTALCLCIAQNAAMRPQPNGEKAVIGVFSLEMSNEQLVNRLLCSQARVDAHRLRSGYLNKDEWRRLAVAVGELAETKIYLDDTPGISVLEMRAKARRLKNEQKSLDLLIVDYLQLMSGRGRQESRQQEVSQISRELKMLAKELNAPLVALSQLSRAPETRTGSHKPQLSDLRESGCLAGETLVTMADSGVQIPIRDLAGKSGFKVWALNEGNFRLEPAVVSRAFATGVKPVFRLTTRLGRTIRATANHKFRAFAGWKRLDELAVGEHLALPRTIENPARQSMLDDELALLGHLIGDGCTLPSHATQYTTKEKDLAEMVAELALKVFGDDVKPRINQERTWYQVYLASTRRHTHNVHSAISEWLGGLGVWGLRSYEKFVPAKVFEQPAAAIGVFLRHLWATDGCIKDHGALHYPSIYYASSSIDLVSGVQSLLFLSSIAEALSGRPAKTNRDVLPREVWSITVLPAMQQLNMTAEQIQMTLGKIPHFSAIRSQNLSRDRAARVAQAIGLEALTKLAQSDIYWDKIVSIDPDGETDVYDLTVPGLHNFVGQGIISHNSIEQDSDVVMFIYREEVYKPETEKQNIAEIIIGKQRNGPTGSVELIFLKQLTRFEDKYREQA